MSGPRVVAVLSGGGAKAAAHLGVARALAEAGVVPVHWVGTSMGSVMAAALASGTAPEVILQRFAMVRRRDVLRRAPFALFRGIWAPAQLDPGPFRNTICSLLDVERFADLAAPCTITAVAQQTGEELRFGTNGEDAPLLDALMGACALPPYYPAAPVNGRPCYDGGLRGPVPLGVVEGIACDRVVVVDVGPGFDEVGPPLQLPPPLLAAADTAIGWLMAGTTALVRERWERTPGLPPLIWLRPVSDRGATFALDRVPAYASAGYDAMRAALDDLG
ncbi:MAG: patatin-like phospholipase family protein [Gemmatimonadales bacterium]|nr:patatin-like phospholipase family protein [Gemmatimonadales bacterium]